MEEIRVLSPTAILGYGFPAESFKRGLAQKPDVIAVDAGSIDPGPYYLGAGVSFTDRHAVSRDLEYILTAGRQWGIPVIIGSAGGSGANPHLKWTVDIMKEISAKNRFTYKLACIKGEFEKDFILKAWQKDKIKILPPGSILEQRDIERSTHIVGQMGVEPLIKALELGAEVIVAGRCYDPAVFAALPLLRGFDAGLALHMGKILECAAIAAAPGSGSDCMMGYLRKDHFLLEPLNPMRKCTTTSVAAHTLYEKSNPYLLPGPGGVIDLTGASFEQYNERVVKVSGSRFKPSECYSIKLEGAQPVGWRTISIAGARDPSFIQQVDAIIKGVEKAVSENFAEIPRERYGLSFHVYGKNGVMGDLEPQQEITSHELGMIIEAVAESQELANTICSFARSTMLHYGYPGRITTAGNLAFPYSPSDIKMGQVYQFNIHHLLEVEDPLSVFPIEVIEIGRNLS